MTDQRPRHISEAIARMHAVQRQIADLEQQRAALIDDLRSMFEEVDPQTVDQAAIRELYWTGSPEVRVTDIAVAMGETANSPLIPQLHRQAGPGEFTVECQDCGKTEVLVSKSRAQPLRVSQHRCPACQDNRARSHARWRRKMYEQERRAAIQYLAAQPDLPDVPVTGQLFINFPVPEVGYTTWDVRALYDLQEELDAARAGTTPSPRL